MMKVAINVVAFLLFGLWVYFVASDFRIYFSLRRQYKVNYFLGLDQLKDIAQARNDNELMNEHTKLKKYKSRIFWIWGFNDSFCLYCVIHSWNVIESIG